MCLIVTHIPASRRDGLVAPAVKTMFKTYGQFRTGVLNKPIPRNGWLLPHAVNRKRMFRYDDAIKGGFIHGYADMTINPGKGYYDARAIGVEAYEKWGGRTGLVCRAMYIPGADEQGDPTEIIATLDSVKSPVGLVKEFPFLRKYIRSWLPKNYR